MPFHNIRPLHILWEENIKMEKLHGIFFGVSKTLMLAGVFQTFDLMFVGQRRLPGYIDADNRLTPYQSLDWHIDLADKNSEKTGHLNSLSLLDSLRENPTHTAEPRYELTIVSEPIYFNAESKLTVLGVARKKQGAIASLNHYLDNTKTIAGNNTEKNTKGRYLFYFCTQMLIMHELGHVFGLFPGRGNKNPTDQELAESHCPNIDCVMFWQANTDFNKKIQLNPFCPSCLKKLRQFFLEP